MDIEINHGHTIYFRARLQGPRRDCDVVEDTIALSAISERVVRPTAQIHRDAVRQGSACRGQRPADHTLGALDELR